MNKPITRKQLAHELGIHPKTLYRWLKKYDLKISRGLLTPAEQKQIYIKLGFLNSIEAKKI